MNLDIKNVIWCLINVINSKMVPYLFFFFLNIDKINMCIFLSFYPTFSSNFCVWVLNRVN